jgi:Holliday junction resolvase RusA-like endonuclease
MKNEFYLRFDQGLPRTTAQMKGETIRYKNINGKIIPYVDHYRKPSVQMLRNLLTLKMKRYKPDKPSEKPIRLTVILYFDVKQPRKLWGTYKTTKPDCDNYVKEIKDVMTDLGFWNDDNQVVDLHIIKYFAEKGTIFIRLEELENEPQSK